MEKMSELKRILYVFTKPGVTMANLGEKPRILVPLMCMVMIPTLSIVLNMGYYHDMVIQQSLTLGMAPDLVYSMAQMQMYVLLITMPIQALAAWLAFSLLAYVLTQMFGGERDITYKTLLSIVGYAFFVKAIYYIVSTINVMVAPDTLLTFSLHDLVSLITQPTNPYITLLLQHLSIFKIWEYALVGVGVYHCAQITKKKAVLLPVILFVIQFAFACGQVALVASLTPQ